MADNASPRKVKPLYIVLGVVVVLAIVALVVTSMSGKGTPPVPTPRTGGVAVAPRPTPTPTPEPTEVFQIFEGRDPFRPLVVEGGDTGASPAPGASASPGATAAPASTAAPSSTTTGVQVELQAITDAGTTATVRVGSNVHTGVKPGQTIESGVVMDSIEGKCARFHRGTDSFRLCEGELVLK